MAACLAHVRMLVLSRVLAGPWATQMLADLGADVIKAERPGGGDDTRAWGPPYMKDVDGKDTRETSYFLCANRSKKSVAIDLATAEGQAVVRDLALQSDVWRRADLAMLIRASFRMNRFLPLTATSSWRLAMTNSLPGSARLPAWNSWQRMINTGGTRTGSRTDAHLSPC